MSGTGTAILERPLSPRKTEQPRDRIDLRADPAWIARIQAQADRLGLGLSAYIRQAVTRQLEQDEAQAPRPRGGKK